MYKSKTKSSLFLAIVVLHAWFFISAQDKENNCSTIAILGTGYVGLVTGACLSEFGNNVLCADIDQKKIDALQHLIMPIYEPCLQEMVCKNVQEKRLSFTTDIAGAIKNADVLFIAVGTPMDHKGAADLEALHSLLETIAKNLTDYKIIVVKSTVPIGTCRLMRTIFETTYHIASDTFDIVSCPEFLREGSAVADFLSPDRVIIGADSEKAFAIVREIYAPLALKSIPFVLIKPTAAEVIKYASNAFLALKLSYINEIANLCDEVSVDVLDVSYALGLDKRIGPNHLRPGPGYGGSCLPKDTSELTRTSRAKDVTLYTIDAAIASREHQLKRPFEKLYNLMNGQLKDKTVAVLGLSFKAGTDDIRYSPAITLIQLLLDHEVNIKAYDPVAMEPMKKIYPHIMYCTSLYDAMQHADAIVIMTEWNEFAAIDPEKAAHLVNERILVDARNIIDVASFKKSGFECDAIGRSCLC